MPPITWPERIAQAPTLPETHELLSRLAARADGGLELFPLEQHAFVGTVVARAHLLAAAGRPEDGLPLLVAASGHTPGVDWAGVPWVSDPDARRADGARPARPHRHAALHRHRRPGPRGRPRPPCGPT